jgi:glycosyltransferase involved in cell wall biosynthesis
MPFFSIIVPIYKVEKYLDECVQSVLSQSFGDYECVLVDDGSPDNCPVMCDEYEAKYEKIKVIHKENGGLSDARNAGILQASGEYIVLLEKPFVFFDNSYGKNSGFFETWLSDLDEVKFMGGWGAVKGHFILEAINVRQRLERIENPQFLYKKV